MKVCSKCEINKEENEFQTYYHKTQNIFRTRGVCTVCFNKQKVDARLKIKIEKDPDKYYSTQEDYSKCRKCHTWKNLTEFYKSSRFTCKGCHNQYNREQHISKVIVNGGSDRILHQPNRYMDQQQREQTFMVMNLMGYTFDEDYGVWVKPPYKIINEKGKVVFNYEVQNKK